jgi:hypothetical protein
MNDRKRFVPLFLTAICTVAGFGYGAGNEPYSTQPLTQKPIMDTAAIAVDLTRFNN